MNKKDMCEAYEEYFAESFGYERAMREKAKINQAILYTTLLEMLVEYKKCHTHKEVTDVIGKAAMQISQKAIEGVTMYPVKLVHIDEPTLNTKIYFTLSGEEIVPIIVVEGKYISRGSVFNLWTWVNLKTQMIERGEGRFYELVGVPQKGTNQTKEGNERQFLLDSFGLVE